MECGKYGAWKMRSVENAEDFTISTTITSTPFPLKSDESLSFTAKSSITFQAIKNVRKKVNKRIK